MPDLTALSIGDMAKAPNGFVLARASLGVTSFGMQIASFPPGFADYPEHNHASMTGELAFANDGQEEVYVPLEGRGTLIADGDEIPLEPGMMVRCGPTQTRKIVTGGGPLTLLTLGGIPGKPYSPPAAFDV
jgi:mannose-6-phosphate isomerase-like protein (cupin superfamily)